MDLLKTLDAAAEGMRFALVTVMHVEGSAYRKTGARMLVNEEGRITGAISGGCLEGDALRKAQATIYHQRSRVVVYDTGDEDDKIIGSQLGCAGVITVLFEPILPGGFLHRALKHVSAYRQTATLVTASGFNNDEHPGTVGVYQHGSWQWSESLQENVREIIIKHLPGNEESQAIKIADWFICYQVAQVPVHLVIAGAGNDVIPVVKMAEILRWTITLVDGRPNLLSAERFGGGCTLVPANASVALQQVEVDKRTALLLLTHNYQYDKTILESAAHYPFFYVGILGPAAKRNALLQETNLEHSDFVSRIYGPTGLNLGAVSAAEIAVSITSEIISVLNKKTGESLRTKMMANG